MTRHDLELPPSSIGAVLVGDRAMPAGAGTGPARPNGSRSALHHEHALHAGPGPCTPRQACAIIGAVIEEMSRLVMLPAAPGHPAISGRGRRAGRQPSRRAAIHKRQITMYLANTALSLSLTAIGEALGRDRTTVGHACAVVEDRRDDAAYDAFVAAAERLINAIFSTGGDQ